MPSYEERISEFEGLDAQVLGISTDNAPSNDAFLKSLGGLSYPLLSDFYPHGAVALRYGVLRDGGVTERALFVVDKEGILRYIDIHDINEKPDNEEVLSILRKVQSD